MKNSKTEWTISETIILGRKYFLLYTVDELIGKFITYKSALKFAKKHIN